MALQFVDPVANGSTLVRQAIRSPNYVAGVSGWAINRDGSVDFNNGTFRGTLNVGTGSVGGIIITGSGLSSTNYVPGVSGWHIDNAGSVEFNAGTFRGNVLIGTSPNQLSIQSGLTAALTTYYGGGGVTVANAMFQMNSGTDYSYLVWGSTAAGVPFLAMGGVNGAGSVQEVWNNTGPNPSGDTEFNLFSRVLPTTFPLTFTVGHSGAQNALNAIQLLFPNLFIGTGTIVQAPGVTLNLTTSGTLNMDSGPIALTGTADYLYAGVPIGRGQFHSGRITADTAAIGTSLTSFIFGGSNAVFPTGRAFRLSWSGMMVASAAGVRVSTQWSMLGSGAIIKQTNPVKISASTITDGIEECNVIFVNTSGSDVTDKIVGKCLTNTGTVVIHAQSTAPKAESVFMVEDIGLATSFPDALSM